MPPMPPGHGHGEMDHSLLAEAYDTEAPRKSSGKKQTEQRDGASICIAVCSVLMAIPALIGS